MRSHKRHNVKTAVLLALITLFALSCSRDEAEKIGVLYVLHGGMDSYQDQYLWDASVQMFSYDPNHPVYQAVIWNSESWSMVLQIEFGIKFIRKYEFEYDRIGGTDPFHTISGRQLADLKAELDRNGYGYTFEVDFASWMSGDRVDHYAYPRYIYNVPAGIVPTPPFVTEEGISECTYCGEQEPGGPWPGCDPERYNVDGPVERLLNKGVSKIMVIDMTMAGIRFYKTFDVVQLAKRALDDWNAEHGTSVPLIWINDYANLMEDSYPSAPEGWTPFLGTPETDRSVVANGRPNPVAADPDLYEMHADSLDAAMSDTVPDADTGIILFNHGLFDRNRAFFDPKINDTVMVNTRIKDLMIKRHPDMDPDCIVGAYGGVKEMNPENGLVERTREMRGEDLAHAYMHETDQELPGGEWGYRYWEALEYLKNRGVRHIVIGFTQVAADSVLTMVEVYNQIGKEIGVRTWLKHAGGNYDFYPEAGHPFADYWGNWVDTGCASDPLGSFAASGMLAPSDTATGSCCFTMGGCDDGGMYPPPRQTPLNAARGDMDPSLAFDLSDYGHLGYDPEKGPPGPGGPVQDQYTGTWEVYSPMNADPRLAKLMARHVMNALTTPLVWIANGERSGIASGEIVTWEARIANDDGLGYTCRWFNRKQGDSDWTEMCDQSASCTWIPVASTTATYDIRCTATDSQNRSGEATWEGFTVW